MTGLDARLRDKLDVMDAGSNNPETNQMAGAFRAVLDLGSGGHVGYVEFQHPTKATTHIGVIGENGDVTTDGYATVEDFHLANARGLVRPLIRADVIRDTIARELGVSDA